MNHLIAIRTELARLGWDESHDRILVFLSRAGVTCLDMLPEEGQHALLNKLKAVSLEAGSLQPFDYSDLLIEIEVHCDRLGINRRGVTIGLWLQANSLSDLLSANGTQLIDLRDFLKGCKPELHTVPVTRFLNRMYSLMLEILDILLGVQPMNYRIANLKETLSQLTKK